MHSAYKLILFFLISLIPLYPLSVYSQSDSNRFTPSFAVTGSYSHNSFRAWGTMENTRQSFLNIQLNHSELNFHNLHVEISSELIIAGRIHYPIDGLNGPKESSFGIGLIPIRLNIPFFNRQNTPFITATTGVFVVDKPFPDSRGTKLNYILEFGLGYRIALAQNRFLEFGYKLHHLSNGNTGMENPGIDSHMFFAGIVLPI